MEPEVIEAYGRFWTYDEDQHRMVETDEQGRPLEKPKGETNDG